MHSFDALFMTSHSRHSCWAVWRCNHGVISRCSNKMTDADVLSRYETSSSCGSRK